MRSRRRLINLASRICRALVVGGTLLGYVLMSLAVPCSARPSKVPAPASAPSILKPKHSCGNCCCSKKDSSEACCCCKRADRSPSPAQPDREAKTSTTGPKSGRPSLFALPCRDDGDTSLTTTTPVSLPTPGVTWQFEWAAEGWIAPVDCIGHCSIISPPVPPPRD
jgi:hypothetical protein